jgi:hypothetical protein
MKKGKDGEAPVIMYIKPETSTDKLQLRSLTVESVTWFTEAFNDMDANTTEELKMSRFIHTRIRDHMVMYAARAKLPGRHSMVDSGRHILTNKQVFTLLSFCVTPTTKMARMEQLKKSLYTPAEAEKIRAGLGTGMIRPSDYGEYYDHMDDYKRRFIKRLELFDEFGKRLLPNEVFSKNDEWGMADYFIYGMLYRKLGKSIWLGVSGSRKAKAAKSFNKYLDYFYERLRQLKLDAERIDTFNKTMSGAAAEIGYDLDDYEESSTYHGDSKPTVGDYKQPQDGKEVAEESGTQDDSNGIAEDGTLLTLQQRRALTDEEKAKLICFKYYNQGTCPDIATCKFSHDPALATKKLMEERAKLDNSSFNPDKRAQPYGKTLKDKPRVSWPEDVVRRSGIPRAGSPG